MTETHRAEIPLGARTNVGALADLAVGAVATAVSRVTGTPALRDPMRIALAYSSERHLSIDGRHPRAFAPTSGFFATADGWLRTHANYPHHAAALAQALGVRVDDTEQLEKALRSRTGADASRAIATAGGVSGVVAPEAPGSDARVRATPLVAETLIGPALPRPLPSMSTSTPLEGIRVLDLTRVIAGPVCTRTLALLGADVLRIDSPHLPEITSLHLDTGHGKRTALLDLRTPGGRSRITELLASSDVVVLGYRPGALASLGLSPEAIAAHSPGVIVAQLRAWDAPAGRGFDSIVQATSGIAMLESSDGRTPGVLPAQALDHSAGYLLAARIVDLLASRANRGGTWLVETSLRRMAAELLGLTRSADLHPTAPAEPAGHLQTFTVDGHVVVTVGPAVTWPGGPSHFAPPRPWGQDEPRWAP